MRSSIELIRSPDPQDCLRGLAALRAVATATVDERDAVIDCLGSSGKSIQRKASDLLVALYPVAGPERDDLIDTLTVRLASESSIHTRWGLVFALGALGAAPPEALPVCLDRMGSLDSDVRWAAVAVVKGIPDAELVLSSLGALAASGDLQQRKMALYALRDCGRRGFPAEEAALRALRDDDSLVRLAALSAVAACCRDPACAVSALTGALSDPNPGVRRAALAAIDAVPDGGTSATAALEVALASVDASMRRAAAQMLSRRSRTAGSA